MNIRTDIHPALMLLLMFLVIYVAIEVVWFVIRLAYKRAKEMYDSLPTIEGEDDEY
jgi:hypothetical protein